MMDSFENVTVEAVRDFILNKGGKVTNHELVKHFKAYLTHPENRVQARNNFKEIVNIVATIIRSDDGEKYLVLKKKFRAPSVGSCSSVDGMLSSPATSPEPLGSAISIHSLPSLYPTPAIGHRFSASQDSLNHYVGPPRHLEPPPYRPPPPPVKTPPNVPLYASIEETMSLSSSQSSNSITKHSSMEDNFFPMNDSNCPPPVPPRRRSSCDKIQPIKTDNKENSPAKDFNKRPRTIGSENEMPGVAMEPENRKISVKECTQKFNRMASESNVNKLFNLPTASTISNALKKRHEKVGDHEDDAVSVSSVGSDPKAREWMIRSARSDYQTLAKLAAENPRLARFKTALHWAAKHGNEDVIKLIAGTYGGDVNVKSNGGYTPLHIAMQFGHEDIFNLLVQVYGADSNIRDYSGRKPRQYQTNQDTSVSADTFRKIKARKKQSEKDLGFLRIGSLNVRVKKTTEALGNFLGKSQSSVEKLHKSWGSADNIQQEYKVMPPPKFAPIKKRKSKRAQDFVSQSTPSTPDLRGLVHSKPKSAENMQDSDSDTACGFGSQWQP